MCLSSQNQEQIKPITKKVIKEINEQENIGKDLRALTHTKMNLKTLFSSAALLLVTVNGATATTAAGEQDTTSARLLRGSGPGLSGSTEGKAAALHGGDVGGGKGKANKGREVAQQDQRKLSVTIDFEDDSSWKSHLTSYGKTMLENIVELGDSDINIGGMYIPHEEAYKDYIYMITNGERSTSKLVQYKLVRDVSDDSIIGMDESYSPIVIKYIPNAHLMSTNLDDWNSLWISIGDERYNLSLCNYKFTLPSDPQDPTSAATLSDAQSCYSLPNDGSITDNDSYGGIVYDPNTFSIIMNVMFEEQRTTDCMAGDNGYTTNNYLYRFYLLGNDGENEAAANSFGIVSHFDTMCKLIGAETRYFSSLQFIGEGINAGNLITADYDIHEMLMIEINSDGACNASPYLIPTINTPLLEDIENPWSTFIDPHSKALLVDMYNEYMVMIHSMDSYNVQFCGGSSDGESVCASEEYCATWIGSRYEDASCLFDADPICQHKSISMKFKNYEVEDGYIGAGTGVTSIVTDAATSSTLVVLGTHNYDRLADETIFDVMEDSAGGSGYYYLYNHFDSCYLTVVMETSSIGEVASLYCSQKKLTQNMSQLFWFYESNPDEGYVMLQSMYLSDELSKGQYSCYKQDGTFERCSPFYADDTEIEIIQVDYHNNSNGYTEGPTRSPTVSFAPTIGPTVGPTSAPTTGPTFEPTVAPTTAPTSEPTVAPTTAPTSGPTSYPTTSPSAAPTNSPTDYGGGYRDICVNNSHCDSDNCSNNLMSPGRCEYSGRAEGGNMALCQSDEGCPDTQFCYMVWGTYGTCRKQPGGSCKRHYNCYNDAGTNTMCDCATWHATENRCTSWNGTCKASEAGFYCRDNTWCDSGYCNPITSTCS